MIVSESKKKIIAEALQNSQRQMKTLAKSIQIRAAQDEFKMQNKFKNLQNPLEFLRNNRTQLMINEAQGLSHKLQSQMSETSQFSKNLYKKVLSNEDYVGFFKDINENQIIDQLQDDMEQILKMQKKLKQEKIKSENRQRQNPKQLLKKTIAEKSKVRNLTKVKGQKQYRHALERNKENIESNFDRNRQIKFHHIKDLNTSKFDDEYKHIEFYNMLKSDQTQNYMAGRQQFNIKNNQQIDKVINRLKFSLIKDSWEFGKESKQIFFFDIALKLHFWQNNDKQDLIFINKQLIQDVQIEKPKDQQILSHFVDFSAKDINLNNILDYGLKIITPELLSSYFKLKALHHELIEREKRDDGLDDKYNDLMKKYEDIKEKAGKDKSRKIPTRIVDSQIQTINNYEQSNAHKFFEKFQLVEDIIYKISKLNKLRQTAMKNYKKKQNLVILKNVCLEIDELLFKLIMLMLKGENFFLKEDPQFRRSVPVFTWSDIIKVQDKHEVERKILELIYANLDKFEVQEVDSISKKTIITTYVEEREKNNKIYDILATKI